MTRSFANYIRAINLETPDSDPSLVESWLDWADSNPAEFQAFMDPDYTWEPLSTRSEYYSPSH